MVVNITDAEFKTTANGATTAFPTAIYAVDSADIAVYFLNATTGVYIQQSSAGYTVSSVGSQNGVTVTFSVAPANGTVLVVVRSVSYTQDLDIQNQRGYNVRDLGDQLDLVVQQVQQLSTKVNRTLRLPVGDAAGTFVDAVQRHNKYVGFDETGLPTLFPEVKIQDFSTRAAFVSWAAINTPIAGQVIFAAGHAYRFVGSGTAISDLPGWIPDGFPIFGKQFGLPTGGNDYTRFVEMLTYASGLDVAVTCEGEGITVLLGQTVNPSGASGVTVTHFNYQPHSSWAYAPGASLWANPPSTFPDYTLYTSSCLFYLGSGVGDLQILYCGFDGRKPGGTVPVANFVLQHNGSTNFGFNSGKYFPDFGYWNTGGNDQEIFYNSFYQWDFNDAENALVANRTGAAFVIASGDCTLRHNKGGYAKFALVCDGAAGKMHDNHWVAGVPDGTVDGVGVVTRVRPYCVWITESGGPTITHDQWDKGGLLANGSAFHLIDVEPHLDQANASFAAQDLKYVVFQPLSANRQLRGIRITGANAIGKLNGATNTDRTASDWFTLDTTYGTIANDFTDSNMVIANNRYRSGQGATQPIPSTEGSMRYVFRTTSWTADTDGTWKTSPFDFSAYMFMPTLFPWQPVLMTAHLKQTGNIPLGRLWAEKVSVGQFRLRCDYAAKPDVVILNVSWNYSNERGVVDGATNTETDVTLVELGGAATGTGPFLIPVSGDYVLTTAGAAGAATGTIAGNANRISLFPWMPKATVICNGAAVNCTVGVASAVGKFVVYTSDAFGRPDQLLFETADVDLSTAGVKTATITQTFYRGQTYWLGFRHGSTATISTWTGATTPDINGGSPVTTAVKTLQRSLTYATAAPTSWVFTSTEINANAAPAIWLKIT